MMFSFHELYEEEAVCTSTALVVQLEARKVGADVLSKYKSFVR